MKIRSLWNLDPIMAEFFSFDEIKDHMKKMDKNDNEYRYHIY